jgi:hypothetical protein
MEPKTYRIYRHKNPNFIFLNKYIYHCNVYYIPYFSFLSRFVARVTGTIMEHINFVGVASFIAAFKFLKSHNVPAKRGRYD